MVECNCGERETFKRLDLTDVSVTACECGANLTAGVREGPVAELPLHEDERSRAVPGATGAPRRTPVYLTENRHEARDAWEGAGATPVRARMSSLHSTV